MDSAEDAAHAVESLADMEMCTPDGGACTLVLSLVPERALS